MPVGITGKHAAKAENYADTKTKVKNASFPHNSSKIL
jgi:hypothetical protein